MECKITVKIDSHPFLLKIHIVSVRLGFFNCDYVHSITYSITFVLFSNCEMEKYLVWAFREARIWFHQQRATSALDVDNLLTTADKQPFPENFSGASAIHVLADVQQDLGQLTGLRVAAHFYNFFTKPTLLPNFSNTMIWPAGVPLLDHLAGLAQGLDAWPPLNPAFFLPLQEQRVVNSRACGSVQVRELTIGSTPQFEVEEVGRWFADMINQHRSNNFVGWVPMMIHTIKTTRAVTARILTSTEKGASFELTEELIDDWPEYC